MFAAYLISLLVSVWGLELEAYSYSKNGKVHLEYYVQAHIGSPPQPVRLTISTNLNYTWVAAVLCNCSSGPFDPDKSSSFVSFEETSLVPFRQGNLTGTISSDFFYLGDLKLKANFTLGTSKSLYKWEDISGEGVLGLGIGSSLISAMPYRLRNYSLEFSDKGYLRFGEPLKDYEFYEAQGPEFKLDSEKYAIGSHYQRSSPQGLVLDSGSDLTYLPSEKFSQFRSNFLFGNCFHWKNMMKDIPEEYVCYCEGGSPPGLPTFNFILKNTKYSLEPSDYLKEPYIEKETKRAVCRLGIAESQTKYFTLGIAFFEKYQAFFDPKNKLVGLKGGQRMNLANVFDPTLAVTGIILFVLLLITIVYFTYKKALKDQNKQLKKSFKLEIAQKTSSDPFYLAAKFTESKRKAT